MLFIAIGDFASLMLLWKRKQVLRIYENCVKINSR